MVFQRFYIGWMKKQLKELLDALCLNWLANDGVWFQAIENKFNMFDAKRCNDTC